MVKYLKENLYDTPAIIQVVAIQIICFLEQTLIMRETKFLLVAVYLVSGIIQQS